jgi:hypothetical protein
LSTSTPQKAPTISRPTQQRPQKHASHLLDFNSEGWGIQSDNDLKALTAASLDFPDEKTAGQKIWTHSANANPELSIQPRASLDVKK